MSLSCIPVSIFPKIVSGETSLADWAAYADQVGLDGYDASVMFFPSHTAVALDLLKTGLKAASKHAKPFMICSYPDFTNPDPAERRRQLDYLARDLAVGSDLGFQYVRVTAGQNHPGLSIDEGAKLCAGCFEQILPKAESYGMKLVFENHAKPGAWHLVDFSFDVNAFMAVYERIKPLPMGINFDTANAVAAGVEPVDLLRKVYDKVWTIHLNDTSTRGKLTSVGLGKGLVDFDTVFKYLAERGFKGWYCIEEAGGNGWQGIDEAVAFARKYVAK